MKEETIKDIKAAHRLKRLIHSDKNRPKFHFCVPFDLGFPADPNAVFFACGRWHLMYIYESREDSYRWGHAISADLVHWSFLDDALIPDETDGGIYSGGVLLEEDGRAVISYWALGRGNKNGGIRIATAYPPLYEKWNKMSGYAVECREWGISYGENTSELACADPGNLWKEWDKYYMQTGNLPLLDKYRSLLLRLWIKGGIGSNYSSQTIFVHGNISIAFISGMRMDDIPQIRKMQCALGLELCL